MNEWRFERKVPLGAEDLALVESWLATHPVALRTAYPDRLVRNGYFDTLDLAHFQAHIAGVESRVKWRLRAYNDGPWQQLEEKRKTGEHGDKKNHTPQAAIAAWSSQTPFLMKQQWLYPMLANQYWRRYLHAPAFGLRVTLDTDLQFARPQGGWLRDPDYVAVLEIKYGLADAKMGAEFLATLPCRVGRFSKYVRGVRLIEVT